MSVTFAEIFRVNVEYEEQFGQIHPCVLAAAEAIWQKSGDFFANITHDRDECLKILMRSVALVSQKYKSEQDEIRNLTAYLYTTFRRLILAEAKRRQRHRELESEARKEEVKNDLCDEEKLCQRILVNQLRARMDEWTRDVFDLQTIGYRYKDLIPKYGSSENVVRSKYSKNLLKLKDEIQAEMANIERELKI